MPVSPAEPVNPPKEAVQTIKSIDSTKAPKTVDAPKTAEVPVPGGSESSQEGTIVIDGKKFREIQIEGEDEQEYLMDDEGNIYNREGKYIGTANADEGEGD